MADVESAPHSEPTAETPRQEAPPAETLVALLRDLTDLRDFLVGRGRHTYELAQRFMQSARRGAADSAYDERQATMLEYQHYIWHEIAGRVDQLLVRYGGATAPDPLTAPTDVERGDARAGANLAKKERA
jgi:hypothetical protein